MSKRVAALIICVTCVCVWAQTTGSARPEQSLPEKVVQVTKTVSFGESNDNMEMTRGDKLDVLTEKMIPNDLFESLEIPYVLDSGSRSSDVLVSNNPSSPNGPFPPHAHSCLAKHGTHTVYCACEGLFQGYPAIHIYKSTDNGENWVRVWGWYDDTWEIYYPSITLTDDYIVVTYDARWNGPTRRLRCAMAPIGTSSFTFHTIDDATPPDGRGLSDVVWMGGNTVGCVYNYRDDATDYDVEFKKSYDGGVTWSDSYKRVIAGSSSSGYYWRPKIWYGEGLLHVTFFDPLNEYVYYSKSTDMGNSWTDPVYFSSLKRVYPDICAYGSDYVLIPCRGAADEYLYYTWTTNGGTSWSRSWQEGRLTEYPECVENDGNWCVAYSLDGNAYYASSPHTERPFDFTQIDDPAVTVVEDVVGICRSAGDRAHVSWTDTRDNQTIWGEMPAGGLPELQNDIQRVTSRTPTTDYKYYQSYARWAAVGVRRKTGVSDWEILLYSDTLFSNFEDGSTYDDATVDFVVVDYHHTTVGWEGVRIYCDGSGSATVEYEDDTEQLVVGNNTGYLWPGGDVVECFDIELTPGKYKFQCDIISGTVDIGVSLFKSSSSPYYAGRYRALEIVDDFGSGADEVLEYEITQSDWYALVLWAKNTAESNYNMIVSRGIEVTAPNGGETWPIESQQTITWTTSGVGGTVQIEYSCDGGEHYPNRNMIKGDWPDVGSYSWTIPYTPTSIAKVRITHNTDTENSDESNGAFKIPQPDNIVDHSSHMPPVRHQGTQESCNAWAVGYYHKTHQEWQEHGWDVSVPEHQFSPAFIYNQINGGVNGYTNIGDAMDLLIHHGCANLVDCPYDESNYWSWPSEIAYYNAIPFRCESRHNIDVSNDAGIVELKQHLDSGCTAVISIILFDNYYNIGEYNHKYCVANTAGEMTEPRHVVCIVGYDDDMPHDDGFGAFKIVNSRGTGWGDLGYFWMSYEAVKNPTTSRQTAFFTNDLERYSPTALVRFSISHPKREWVRMETGIGPLGNPLWKKQFFNWAQQPEEGHDFPNNNIVLDISQGADTFDAYGTNNVYLKCWDTCTPPDGVTGVVQNFSLVHNDWGAYSQSSEPPVLIPDDGTPCYTNLTMPTQALHWQSFHRLPDNTGITELIGDLGTKSLFWVHTTEGYGISLEPCIGDIDNDGYQEVVIGSADNHIYALNGEDGSVYWSYPMSDVLSGCACLGDIDGDGQIEVVVPNSDSILALNGEDGSWLWSYPIHILDSSPCLGDIDGDGQLEVVVGSHDNIVLALNGEDGSFLWSFPTGGFLHSSPCLGDVDGDGWLEVLFGSDDNYIYALDGKDGSFFWSRLTGGFVNSPCLGDIEGDGKQEVVVGSVDGNVYALNAENGSVAWASPVGGSPSSPCLGNIDGDDNLEVVVGVSDGNVCALSAEDGSPLWSYPTRDAVVSSPSLGDIDGDGQLEVIVGSNDHNAYALNGEDGSLLWLHRTGKRVMSSPALGDLDGDGLLEVVIHAGDNNIYALHEGEPIDVTAPGGGEYWYLGDVYEITWHSRNIDESVKIDLYKGGNHYTNITGSTSNSGTYVWNVPLHYDLSRHYQVRISSIDNPDTCGYSAGYFTLTSKAQNRDTTWAAIYGGADTEWGTSVQQTFDGGYIIAGCTRSFGAGADDIYLVRVDTCGDILWTKTYGGMESDWAHSVEQTSDSGYIVAGYTYSYGAGDRDVWLIKTNVDGDTLWTRTYGGVNDDGSYSVRQTSDGGYIVAGYTKPPGMTWYDFYLVKTDSVGEIIWSKNHGKTDDSEVACSVLPTPDGYIIVGGYGEGTWMVKTNTSGDTVWTKTYGNASVWCVQQTSDGGYILGGTFWNYMNDCIGLLKTDANGDSIWVRSYGDMYEYDPSYGRSCQQTSDGGYIVVGSKQANLYMIKTDADGDTLWSRIYGGSGYESGEASQQTSDGGYIVMGPSNSFAATDPNDYHYYLVKTDSLGNTPVITVSSPNGGESWAGGTDYGITWLTTDSDVDYIRFVYSVNGGSTYLDTITDSCTNSGIFTWNVPRISSTTVRVKGEALDGTNSVVGTDESNNDFTIYIVPPSTPNILAAKKDSLAEDFILLWNSVTTDTLDNQVTIDHYVVYRDTTPSYVPSSAESIGTVLAPETTFIDIGALVANENYYYLVQAVDEYDKKSKKSNMAYVFRKFLNENPAATDKKWMNQPWDNE